MAGRIRVLDAATRTMQRLGYLKALCAIVNESETSNLSSLGKRLIERVTKRIKLSPPYDEQIRDYVRLRLTDGAYRNLRKNVLNGANDAQVSLEIQDLYLADNSLPSRTGKLVEADWRSYPYLGTSLELIKKGTYSALTRSFVLLAVTPREEFAAFLDLDRDSNPLRISDAQAIILLYCLVDNDAEVILPFFQKVISLPERSFDERSAGDLLPDILRSIVKSHQNKAITGDERNRLSLLTKTAATVEKWKGKAYTGGGAREITVRVRLEPYCDLGFLTKPNIDRYEYQVPDALRIMVDRWQDLANTDRFLQDQFFNTFAACRNLRTRDADEAEAIEALVQAGQSLKSSLGYSPIMDVGLLAGVRLLTEKGLLLELGRTVELLKALQKQDPHFVRFTVDRMGTLAYVKFLKEAPEN
jgi:hypothetical protein